ncbi:hypothetical protein [Parasynechococcus marenigrum]|uniref:Nucleotide-diphospho-sugar transferase domain-containing protein n=1 Tax=Parasynechococcus marenigrum (strain WH8102) TaxID=84588 RepID=Q7U922_PARMW|nr:hypothetical protein [Parasynechococcus marenigrum]CAE06952.1 hypothetical [Parasynechococcus marenigrum WH 8102]
MSSIDLRLNSSSDNWLITLAIGSEYLRRFDTFIYPLVKQYCIFHHLGLAVIVDDITADCPTNCIGKKKTWQKFLAPHALSSILSKNINVCYFDSDILFNPYGKNIFNTYDFNSLGIVSQLNGLPGDDLLARKIMSFHRHHDYSDSYPLDSAIFMSIKDYYTYHNYEPYDDVSCAGLFVCNSFLHSQGLREIYIKYDDSIKSITDSGDEPAFNFEIRNNFNCQILPYEFQAIWNYEMAWNYRHLYLRKDTIDESVIASVVSCLSKYTALHFAGSWYESKLCYDLRIVDILLGSDFKKFSDYLSVQPSGIPVGRILPC